MGKPTENQVKALLKFKVPQSEIDEMDFEAASKKMGELIEGLKDGKPSSYKGGYSRKSTVKRNIPDGAPDEDIQKAVNTIIVNAYAAAKKELPEEDENTQTFGYAYGAWKNVIARKFF